MQLLPGIKSAGDGNSGFYVRGGGTDQNLILLDGTPVYNASHLLGFFSTFNGDPIKELSFDKSAIPAQYGGRLSSVIHATTNEGGKEQYHMSGGVGMIAARLNAEGPIQKNKSSFLVSGRRTYADLFVKLSPDSATRNNDLNFYDLNAKLNFTLGAKDELAVTCYIGHDLMRIGNSFGLEWGNKIASLRWKHSFNTQLNGQASFHYSNYDYTTTTLLADEPASIYSEIRDYTGKAEVQYTPGAKHETRMGPQSTYHTMYPSILTAGVRSGINNQEEHPRFSIDNAAYINHTWKPNEVLKLSYGIRITVFNVMGGGDFYGVDSKGLITDTMHNGWGEVVKTYINPEPRIAASYYLRKASFSFAYARNVQHLHLLSNATSANPADRWVGSNNMIKPEIADQLSADYTQRLAANNYEMTIETYYKTLQNQSITAMGPMCFPMNLLNQNYSLERAGPTVWNGC